VELTLGRTSAHSAFLIDPTTLSSSVSLIVNGGVKVFVTRNPAGFQIKGAPYTCGEAGPGPIFGGSQPLTTLGSKSGIYGYGIIDGQGHRSLIRDGKFSPSALVGLIAGQEERLRWCEQRGGGKGRAGQSADDLRRDAASGRKRSQN
jgi:hypothetical protein